MQFRFDGHQFLAASFFFRLQAQCSPLSRLAADGQTHREPTLRIGRLSSSGWFSRHQTICHDLHKYSPRAERYAVFITAIKSPQFPAAAMLEGFENAVSSAGLGTCINCAAAVFLRRPDCLQVPLTAIRRVHQIGRDQQIGRFKRTEAARRTIGRVVGDSIGGLHPGTLRVRQEREGVVSRVPSLGYQWRRKSSF